LNKEARFIIPGSFFGRSHVPTKLLRDPLLERYAGRRCPRSVAMTFGEPLIDLGLC